MNKKATSAIALFLVVSMVTVQALAPLAIFAIGGVVGGVAGVLFDRILDQWLGIELFGDKDDELIAHLQGLLTDSETENRATIEQWLNDLYGFTLDSMNLQSDFTEYTQNYAWALAKYEFVKTFKETGDVTQAKLAAKKAVKDYYETQIENVVARQNAQISAIASAYTPYYNLSVSRCSWVADGYEIDSSGSHYLRTITITKLTDQTFNVTKWHVYRLSAGDIDVTRLTYNYCLDSSLNGREFFNYTIYSQEIDDIDAAYQNIIANLDAYFDAIQTELFTNITVDDLIDPYVLASQLATDRNTTGYMGYAAAELALLGLSTAGINKTAEISYNGNTYSGWLFTDWDTQFNRSETYTVPAGNIVYILTDDGKLIPIEAGENFTITNLTDWKGNVVNSTTTERYVMHSANSSAILEELQALHELYEKYIEMQTIAGGGSSSVGDWWNSLSDTEKLAIAGAAVLFIVLLARK